MPNNPQHQPTNDGHKSDENGERFRGRPEDAYRRADKHAGNDMRRRPDERRSDVDPIEASSPHAEHPGQQRNERTNAGCESGEKNAPVTMPVEEKLTAPDQFRIFADRPNAKNLALVSSP